MAYQLTGNPNGELSLGNVRGLWKNLVPAVSDYATGGYLVKGIAGTTESTGNVGLAMVLFIIPVGGQGGYVPVFNPSTSKVQVYLQTAATGPLVEVPANTDLSAYSFGLLIVGQ